MIERICENCGKTFLKRKRAMKITKHDFCCRECSKEYRLTHSTNIFKRNDDYCEIIINSRTFGTVSVMIDNEDIEKCKVYSWVLSQHKDAFYIVARNKFSNKRGNIYLHNLILDKPSSLVIDHINRNPFDNRKSNLRICNQSQNNYNKDTKLGATNEKYISFDKRRNKYRISFYKNGKQIFGGYFDNLEQAIIARNSKIKSMKFKEFINI